MPREHSFDTIAEHLTTWIDETATTLAHGMRENGRAPFSADANQRERMAYYEDKFFLPDGSDNDLGRQQERARLGLPQYTATLAEVVQAKADRMRRPGDQVAGDVTDG